MFKKTLLFVFVVLLLSTASFAQENKLKDHWQIGIGFGELPMHGSFKPSITIGYYPYEKLYIGFTYQFKDRIQRNGTSFNASSTGLDGLESAYEDVAQRFFIQGRYTPVKYGPYISFGIVYNGEDSETMEFDNRGRTIRGREYSGNVKINQTREAGWGPALGIGYQYDFDNVSLNAEWSPAWLNGIPEPEYKFSGTSSLSDDAKREVSDKMTKEFKSSVTNLYKVFHIGVSYRIK